MEDMTYNYIVIGAGIAGLSAAYHLGKDGHTVLVLEGTDGTQSTSFASTAEMNHDPDTDWYKVTEQFGLEGAWMLWKLCSDALDTLSEFAHQNHEPHFKTERVPAYFFSYRDSQADRELLQAKYEFYKSIDAYVSLDEFAPGEISNLLPSFRAVLTTHGDGVTNNQSLLKTLARRVREQGNTILHSTHVARISQSTCGEVHTADGTKYTATRIIIATGDGSNLLPTSLEIEHKRTFVISLERNNLPELFKNSVMWDTDKPYHYIRSFGGDRLWVGGEDVYESEYAEIQKENREAYEESKYKALEEYAQKVLGTDDSYTRQAAWSGLFYPTKRSLPYIEEIPDSPLITSVGFGGTGIITSFISGYLIAAWARGEMLEYKKLFALDWN